MGSTKAPPKPSSSSNRFATIAAAIYGAVVCAGMWNHEMWRDELEVFAKIRDNTLVQSLTALDDPTLYFYSLLSVVKLFGSSPIAYQAFHGIVATLAAFVFCRFGRFTRTQKILFIFGYFALFDYGIISRDYSFSLLLTWIGVAVVARRPRRYVLSAVVLGVVATHGMYTLFISLGLTAYLVVELGMRARDRGLPAALRRELAIATPLLGAFWLLAALKYSALAASRSAQFTTLATAPPWRALSAIWLGYVPLPDFSAFHFWGTNIVPFEAVLAPGVAHSLSGANLFLVAASVLILIVAATILSDRPPVLAAFLVTTALHLLFLDYLSVIFVRYTGFLFVVFVYCWWLRNAGDDGSATGGGTIVRLRRALATPFFTLLLLAQLVAGLFTYARDAELRFGGAAPVAAYLEERGVDDGLIVGYIDYVAAPVAILLDRKFYFPESRSFGSYVDWRADAGRNEDLDFTDVLAFAADVLRDEGGPVLFVLSFEIQSFGGGPMQEMTVEPGIELRRLAAFEGSLIADESYYLYEMVRQ